MVASALTAADFTLTTTSGVTLSNTIQAWGGSAFVTPTGGETKYRLGLAVPGVPDGTETLTINPASATSIYNSTDVNVKWIDTEKLESDESPEKAKRRP